MLKKSYCRPGRVLTIWRLLHMLCHFDPLFSGLLKICIVSTPIFEEKNRKMSYFDPYFLAKFCEMYSFDPPFSPYVAFWVKRRCWASLSETQPMESNMHILYFTKLSGESQDFYFLVSSSQEHRPCMAMWNPDASSKRGWRSRPWIGVYRSLTKWGRGTSLGPRRSIQDVSLRIEDVSLQISVTNCVPLSG